MITRFNDIYEFDEDYKAIVTQSVKYEGPDTEVKVFIPILMPNIMQGGTGTCTLNNPYSRVFVNSSNTFPIATKSKITERNYLKAKVDINATFSAISTEEIKYIIHEIRADFYVYKESAFIDPFLIYPNYSLPDNNTDSQYRYASSPDRLDEAEDDNTNTTNLLTTKLQEVESINNTTTKDSYYQPTEDDILFKTNNTKNLSFVIFDEDDNELFNSNNRSSNQRLNVLDNDDTLYYKSHPSIDGMYYDQVEEKKEYTIKEGSSIQCNFLNSKLSKLYLNSGPENDFNQ